MATSTTTTSIVLNWTPAGGTNSLSQDVQRSPAGAGTWTTLASGLSASASTYTDNTAIENTLYDYQILNNCSYGGPASSGAISIDDITCPSVTALAAGLVISGSYGVTYNDVSYVSGALYDATGTTKIQDLSPVPSGQAANTYSFTTSGVNYNTSYVVRFVVGDGTFTKECDTAVSTGDVPACNAPTNLSLSIA